MSLVPLALGGAAYVNLPDTLKTLQSSTINDKVAEPFTLLTKAIFFIAAPDSFPTKCRLTTLSPTSLS
jgi:hypothetical protein